MSKELSILPTAFPIQNFPLPEGGNLSDPGMLLRDWFAGLALQGMNASPELMEITSSGSIKDGSAFNRMAKMAYLQADAMIAARTKVTVSELSRTEGETK